MNSVARGEEIRKHIKMALTMPEEKKFDFKEVISGFTIPPELLDDIVYCQKSLQQYIRVHQILATRLGEKLMAKPVEDIEREISDIGREQKGLLSNLRSALELYYTSIKEKVEIDREMGNAHVTRLLSHHIDNSMIATPKSVKKRYSESQLLAKFELEDQKRMSDKMEMMKLSSSMNIGIKQVSLLKPKSERFALQKCPINSYAYARKQLQKTDINGMAPTAARSINSSRLNLLEALNKARNQSLTIPKRQLSPPAATTDSKQIFEILSSQSSTTSDDSLDVPLASPTHSEEEMELILNQEMFLRKFGLYTLEYSHHLQQRRSKRKRRTVQSNEKSDFHYGKLELFEKMNKINKRKKTFLYSPPATRALKKRRTEKYVDGTASTSKPSSLDRSSSSSPDQKIVCNECSKSDNLNKCETCSAWFHVKCHKVTLTKQTTERRNKVCPRCYAIFKETKDIKDSKESRPSTRNESSLKI